MTARATNAGLAAGACAGLALVLAWVVPSRLVLAGDEFGYVDSVVETVRAHRWVASDWLEPLNLPLTAISAGAYAVTGNFYLSTLGFNLGLALLNLGLLELGLRGVLRDPLVRWPFALAVAISPVWLYKSVTFTGVPMGLTCLLAAWHCWSRGWRLAFFLGVLVAALNRQSALCLLAWPLAALWQQGRAGVRWDRGLLAGSLVTAGVAGGTLLAAPATWARQLSKAELSGHFSILNLGANVLLALVVLVGWRALVTLLRGEPVGEILRRNRAAPWRPLALMVVAAGLIGTGVARVLCEAPGLEPYSLALVMVAAVLAWLHDWDQPVPRDAAAYAGLFVLLVSWRGRWWDYYFLEPMLVLLLAWPKPAPLTSAAGPRAVAWAALLAGIAGLPALQQAMADTEVKVVAYEQALRRGELEARELSDAPFGFLGWKLFPHARRQPGAAALIDFLKFVEGARARCVNGQITVDRDGGRKSIHPTGERRSLPANFRGRFLPLNNAEWRGYIERGPEP